MTTTGRVRSWDADEGWGVIDSDSTPGGCWAHASSVLVEGVGELRDGEEVELVVEAAEQDGYAFRAVEVWPSGSAPVRTPPIDSDGSTAYTSVLTLTFDDDAPV